MYSTMISNSDDNESNKRNNHNVCIIYHYCRLHYNIAMIIIMYFNQKNIMVYHHRYHFVDLSSYRIRRAIHIEDPVLP